jgi:hypothetical protein
MVEIESKIQTPVRSSDESLARAYRDIESSVFDVCNAARVLELLAEGVLEADSDLRKRLGLSDKHAVYVLGENDAAALFYALYQVGNLADKLVDEWTEGLQKQAPVSE